MQFTNTSLKSSHLFTINYVLLRWLAYGKKGLFMVQIANRSWNLRQEVRPRTHNLECRGQFRNKTRADVYWNCSVIPCAPGGTLNIASFSHRDEDSNLNLHSKHHESFRFYNHCVLCHRVLRPVPNRLSVGYFVQSRLHYTLPV